jgi:hypothetical protein
VVHGVHLFRSIGCIEAAAGTTTISGIFGIVIIAVNLYQHCGRDPGTVWAARWSEICAFDDKLLSAHSICDQISTGAFVLGDERRRIIYRLSVK